MIAHHSRYGGKELGKCESFFKLEPETLCLTAIKKADREDETVVRFFNPTAESVEAEFWSRFEIKGARLLKLSEEPIEEIPLEDGHTVTLGVPGRKIITLGLRFR